MAVAALFDVDGTLLARNTAPLYMSHLRRTGQARRRDLARTFYYLLWYKLGLLDVHRALEVTMEFVRGRDEGTPFCRNRLQATQSAGKRALRSVPPR